MACGRLTYSPAGIHVGSSRSGCSLARLELALLVIAGCILLFVAGAWAKNLLASDSHLINLEITVGRGDTLWSVAQKYGDPEEYILERVDKLAKANGLVRGAVLSEGQTLIVLVAPNP